MTPAEEARSIADRAKKEADQLANLTAKYPDLKKYVGRWNKVAYYSSQANAQTTDYDLRHNCGCCNDSPLELWPYLSTEDGRVYSDPPSFMIGERDDYQGERAYDGWEEKLRRAKIPEALIERVSAMFEAQSRGDGDDD